MSHAKKIRITKRKILGRSRWIPFCCFREEVENVSANQRPGRPSWFSDRPDKHKISKRRIKSCFLSSFVEFHSAVSEKSKMSQAVGGQGGHLAFPISPPKTNLVVDNEILRPVKFRWILLSSLREEVENVSANHRPGRPFCFSNRLKQHKLCRGHWDLASCQVSITLLSGFKVVDNFSANQMPERPSCFSDRSEKHKLSKRKIKPYFLSSFVKIPFNDFREDVENV